MSVNGDMAENDDNVIKNLLRIENAKDAEEMYYKLSLERGEVAEKELLYQFRCAIYYATVKKADPKKLRWWYWRDKDENAGLSDEELLKIYEKQPPVV